MEVSMAALFRLACASFLFGGVLYLSIRMVCIFFRAFSASKREPVKWILPYLPECWDSYIAKRSGRPLGKIPRFFFDFLLTM